MLQSRVSNPTAVAILVLVEMALLTVCYFSASFWGLLVDEPWLYFRYDNGWLQLSLVVIWFQAGLYLLGLYEEPVSFPLTHFAQHLLFVTGTAFLAQALLGYGKLDALQLPQWTMVYGSLMSLLILPLWRMLFFFWIRGALPSTKLLLLGSSPELDEIRTALRVKQNLRYAVIHDRPAFADYELTGFEGDVDRIVVSQTDPAGQQLPVQALLDARLYGVRVESAADLYESVFGRVPMESLRPTPFLLTELPKPRRWALLVQTLYSRIVAAAVLLFTLLPFLIVALLLKLTTPAEPILERKRVLGWRGVPFTLYSFRSTPWLHKLGLEKLPHFWNLLRGDMVLVGPQPERPEVYQALVTRLLFYHLRHTVRPGLTGWAQIHGTPGSSAQRMTAATELEYDLYYVKHMDPAMDAYVLLQSLRGRV